MSQTQKALKTIATGEPYQSLVKAIDEADYTIMAEAYGKINIQLQQARNEIKEKIEALPRKNKQDEFQKFESSFRIASETILPSWHWMDSILREQKIFEGTVQGFGSQGDPMVRTPEGKIVIISGSELQEGDAIVYKIVNENEKIAFGHVFEFTPDSMYYLLTQGIRSKVRTVWDAVRERADAFLANAENATIEEMAQILGEFEESRSLASKLREDESQRIFRQITIYRRKMFTALSKKLAPQLVAEKEEREIERFYASDPMNRGKALSALGIFRLNNFDSLKTDLLESDKLQKYQEHLDSRSEKLSSMDSAMEIMELKQQVDDALPQVQVYFEKMENLHNKLSRRALDVANELAESDILDAQTIREHFVKEVAGKAPLTELRRIFRTASDFNATRDAVMELSEKIGMTENIEAEAAFKPYMRQKLEEAFGKN